MGGTSQAYLIAIRPAKAFEGDKKMSAWSQWVSQHVPDRVDSDGGVRGKDGQGIIISDALYGAKASIEQFILNKRPFIIGLRKGGAFDHVLHELGRIVKRQNQWAVAWSVKMGVVVVVAYPPQDGSRKSCVSNLYNIIAREEPIKFGALSDEALMVYVKTGVRIDDLSIEERKAGISRTIAVVPSSLTVVSSRNNTQENVGPLPASWCEVSCRMMRGHMSCCTNSDAHCDNIFYMQVKKKVVVKVGHFFP
tara:strand:- start:140 stop:889 length:750 start_codon:yes stop_codon:yes gene_type:complete